jgi:FtsP/CotA-like multicopper oxidase with cupredoxin domain
MGTAGLLALDVVAMMALAAAWVAAAVMWPGGSGRGREWLWQPVLAAAVLLVVFRGVLVMALAGRGWWFAQEKVLLSFPLLVVPATVALVALARGATALVRPALLATAYAAVVGLLTTLAVGYPLRPLPAVLLAGGWAGAAAVTWATSRPRGGVFVVARALAVVVAVTLVASLVDGWRASRPDQALDLSAHTVHGGHAAHVAAFADSGSYEGLGSAPDAAGLVSVTDLRGPDGEPDRRFELTAQHATVTLPSGQDVAAWTYDGQVPGPQLRVRQGDLVEVVLRNRDIEAGVTIHWHGYDVPNAEDGVAGVTQDAVPPGGRHVYRFRAEQTGSYWYHSHQSGAAAVPRGLFGTLVVEPPDLQPEVDLTVPVHTLGGSLVVGGSDEVSHHHVRVGEQVRLRLVNAGDVPRRFSLPGAGFQVAAVDGYDLAGGAVVRDRAVRLGAGGRLDLIFTMPATPVWLTVDRQPRLVVTTPGRAAPEPPPRAGAPVLDLLDYGTPARLNPDPPGEPDRSYTLVLDRQPRFLAGRPAYAYTVNGRVFPDVPPLAVTEGDLVEVTIVNRGTDTHPMHLHGHHAQLISRDGRPSTGAELWLDTVDVEPGQVWRVRFRADNPGLWMYHCHDLAHAALGMVIHVHYDGVVTPYRIGAHNHPE